MPIITRIVQQQKDKERVNIYLDGKYAFPTTLESVLQNNLKVGKELSLQQINDLKNTGDFAKIFNKALNFVMSRPHSERETKLWFKKKKIDESLQGLALQKLAKLNLVDDLAFSKWWIEQREAFRPKPTRVLKLELRQKGVAQDVIEEALGGMEPQDEVETAKRVVAKKLDRFRKMPPLEGKRKLSEFLARRGFSWDIVKQIVEQGLEK